MTKNVALFEAPAGLPGVFTETSWKLPKDLPIMEWVEAGRTLQRMNRAVNWWIGDWIAYGQRSYGDIKKLIEDPAWAGPSYKTCLNAATVCRFFETSRRRELLDFSHHAEIIRLSTGEAEKVLERLEKLPPDQLPSTRELRTFVKQQQREQREEHLAGATARANAQLHDPSRELFSVLYVDPPWRQEPWSRETGLDRAPDNHYPTMTDEQLCELSPPAAKNCVMFLWRTAPKAHAAHCVLEAWDFEYRSEFIWKKDRRGTGYWNRNMHEVLMIAVRGDIPAPAPGTQFDSVIEANVGKHSAKPAIFGEMIKALYPRQRVCEMFGRGKSRFGFVMWGNETDIAEAAD